MNHLHITIHQPPLPTDRLRIPAHLAPCGDPEPERDARRAHADSKLREGARPVKERVQKGRTE